MKLARSEQDEARRPEMRGQAGTGKFAMTSDRATPNKATPNKADPMRVTMFESLGALPDRYQQLFELAGRESFFQSWHWYSHLIDTIGTDTEKLRIYGAEKDDSTKSPVAALILRELVERPGIFPTRTLKSFTNFYSYSFSPIQSAESDPMEDYVRALVAAICAERRRWDVLQFEAIRKPSPFFDHLHHELKAQGMLVHPYFQAGNSYQDVRGLSSAEYIGQKGRSISQELLRKERKLMREKDVRIELITEPGQLKSAIPDYQKIYEASWKEPEAYPEFIPELMRISAHSGRLRLGMLYIAGEPVASQVTIISGERGIMYKTAFDPQYGKSSVGNVIMVNVIRHLIDVDKIAELDFGLGDDPYKNSWLTDRRESWGLMAFNPRTLMGALGAVRHIYGPATYKFFTIKNRP